LWWGGGGWGGGGWGGGWVWGGGGGWGLGLGLGLGLANQAADSSAPAAKAATAASKRCLCRPCSLATAGTRKATPMSVDRLTRSVEAITCG
jgi:hypothetical protein